jgi:galactose mutarotase-like enzyme
MSIVITHGALDGFATIQAANDHLALTIVPELGGKIASLRDRRTGREWLWRHPRMAYARVAPDESYTARADTGGWDECLPTVAACSYPAAPWAGTALPDHGELWSQAAQVDRSEQDALATIRCRWQGAALPYAVERVITLAADQPSLRFDYRMTNTGTAPLRFIWCAHPLLAIAPGMRLELPPAARFNVWSSIPDDLLRQSSDLVYPVRVAAYGRAIVTDPLPDPSAAVAFKLWSEPLADGDGWARLHAADGSLGLRWDVAQLPQIACWLNLGAWAGDGGAPYYNLGLEPCIGAQDSLAEAITRHDLAPTVAPGESYPWWLEVELSA